MATPSHIQHVLSLCFLGRAKNEWSYTSTSPQALRAWRLNTSMMYTKKKYRVIIKEIDTFNVMQYQNRQRSGHASCVVA
jgi:hypothetical protein